MNIIGIIVGYVVKNAVRKAVDGITGIFKRKSKKQKEAVMQETIMDLIGQWARKAIALACGVWIDILIKNGVLTQPQVDTIIQGVVAILLFLGVMLYTNLKNKINKKVTMKVSKELAPTVVYQLAKLK